MAQIAKKSILLLCATPRSAFQATGSSHPFSHSGINADGSSAIFQMRSRSQFPEEWGKGRSSRPGSSPQASEAEVAHFTSAHIPLSRAKILDHPWLQGVLGNAALTGHSQVSYTSITTEKDVNTGQKDN